MSAIWSDATRCKKDIQDFNSAVIMLIISLIYLTPINPKIGPDPVKLDRLRHKL